MPPRRARPILKGIDHGLSCYKAGCGCAKGRKANRDYSAMLREQKKTAAAQQFSSNVTKMRVVNGGNTSGAESDDSPALGIVEQSVIEECAKLPAAQERPAMVQIARSMARILDAPTQVANHPTATRQLTSILDGFRGGAGKDGKRKSGGRLATVQKMQRSRREIGA